MFTLGFAIPSQVAAAFPLRVTVQRPKVHLNQQIKNDQRSTEETLLPEYLKSIVENVPEENLEQCLKLYPTSTHNYNFRKKNFANILQKILNKKFGSKCIYTVDTNTNFLIVSSKHDSTAKCFLYQPRPYFADTQIRGFKTERIIEKLKNESLSHRLKTWVKNTEKENINELFRDVDLKEEWSGILSKSKKMSSEELARIKLSFAEGYLLGAEKKSESATTKSQKFWKMFMSLVVFVVTVTCVVSLFMALTGSIFKINITSQSEVNSEQISITFNDIKGVDEAKQELTDIVEFLKNPEKFSVLGGKLPKGVLLVGPPGTGKTLLARAVAGEAGVPFFHAAGSEFDEVLVGQGARRVRDLFKAAKERSPCVVFIDEIDSIGSKRTNSVFHPYANQTINQLLTEMDGFHQNHNIVVLGATNRRDDLDRALLRPGRFDIEVDVPIPDYSGRKQILELYLKKINCQDIDIDLLARGSTGFTGADLENMVNQAAVKAASEGAKTVSMKHLEVARDKILMGPEKKTKIPDDEANKITAYHEGGHAIVAYYTKDSHPLHKVTIMPRGSSLGHTAYIPAKEEYHITKSRMLAIMDTMMGGRAAEELIFGADKVTTGASNDLKQATNIATRMVKELGMSEKVGLRTHDSHSNELMSRGDLSPSTNEIIDQEIKRIMQESYDRAKNILIAHQKEHKQLAEALLQYETLDADDIKALLNKSR